MCSIIASIVLYKSTNEVLEAIYSVLNTQLDVKLYLIDNSPTDELQKLAFDERIEYIYNGANVGFGAAHNIAIQKSAYKSQYHLILNPDISFEAGVLERIFDFMEAETDIGLVMPKIVYKNADIQYLCKKLPTPFDLIVRRFIPSFIRGMVKDRINTYELRHKDYDSQMDVPNLSGCFMFIRTDVLQDVGVFDESFFMYLEDVDLVRRINRKYRTVYFPSVLVQHGYAKESYKSLKLLRYHIMSAIKYFNKWGWIWDSERKKINSQY